MQAPALLLHWGSYHCVCNLWGLVLYLFFLPVMLPSVVPRLATDLAVTVFPGVWKLLSFYLLHFFLPPFEDNGLLFWVPDVLCLHSKVVLWHLLSIQMFI